MGRITISITTFKTAGGAEHVAKDICRLASESQPLFGAHAVIAGEDGQLELKRLELDCASRDTDANRLLNYSCRIMAALAGSRNTPLEPFRLRELAGRGTLKAEPDGFTDYPARLVPNSSALILYLPPQSSDTIVTQLLRYEAISTTMTVWQVD